MKTILMVTMIKKELEAEGRWNACKRQGEKFL
jgi:hypothetical protein